MSEKPLEVPTNIDGVLNEFADIQYTFDKKLGILTITKIGENDTNIQITGLNDSMYNTLGGALLFETSEIFFQRRAETLREFISKLKPIDARNMINTEFFLSAKKEDSRYVLTLEQYSRYA